jgi:hypothetical protein
VHALCGQADVAHPGPVTETGATIGVASTAAHVPPVGLPGPGSRQYSYSHEKAPVSQKVKDIWEDTKDVARERITTLRCRCRCVFVTVGAYQVGTWHEWTSMRRAEDLYVL